MTLELDSIFTMHAISGYNARNLNTVFSKCSWCPLLNTVWTVSKIKPNSFWLRNIWERSGKVEGNKTGVTRVFYRALKRTEAAGDLIILTIDEYKTSRICNRCGTDSLASVTHVKGHGVLVCKT
ncbi:MAG: hypothetical protein EXX96DRAFT_544910, partial [Benjaminiella poitrasii]